MPDTPIPEAPRVTNQEALHMHNENVVTEGIDPARLDELQRLRRESTDPRDFLRKFAEGKAAPSFSSEKTADLQLSFGAGKATRNAAGDIELQAGTGGVEEQLFNEARTVITELTNLQRYSDLLTKADRAGKTPEQYATDEGLDFNAIRNAGIDSATSEILYEISPELRGVTDVDALREVVDQRLVRDPNLRREISTLLSQVKMPRTEVSTNATVAELTDTITNATDKQNAAATEIRTFLDGIGADLTGLPKPVDELVKDYAKLGYTTEQLLNNLALDILPKYPNYESVYLPHFKKEKELEEMRQRYLKYDKGRNAGVYTDYKKEYDKLKREFDSERTTLNGNAEFQTVLKIRAALSYDKSNPSSIGRVAQRTGELVMLQAKLNEATTAKAKAETEGNLATTKSRDERLEQERQAIAELSGIIPKAIAKTLLERAQQADVVRQRENTRAFDTETRQMFDVVRESLRTRGFGLEMVGGRGIRVNERDLIIHDARNLAVNKEDGLRQLTLEHMGLWGIQRTNDQGEDIPGETIETVDHLNARQRALFDRIYASESQAIKMKVARDLMLSQSFRGKILDKLPIPGRDKNGLNDAEWEEFGKFYKNDTEKIVNSTKEGRDAVAQLEAAGIKPDSTRGRNILMWLAIILGGGMTIASLGGLATVIPALAGTGVSGIKAVATGLGGGTEAVAKGA